MRVALRLAARGKGRTRPNPPVGAVVVKAGKVVGAAYHQAAGEPHAEVLALERAGSRAGGATLYSTLEPCLDFPGKRTPPCVPEVVRRRIRRVVIGTEDPNPGIAGRGIAALRRRGVRVDAGILGESAAELIAGFASRVTRGRPRVTLKVAQTLDGKIAAAGGASRWITGPGARHLVHRLRAESDAVIVGIGTVLADDPALTARGIKNARQPVRIVMDGRLRTPPGCRLFTEPGGAVWIATLEDAPREAARALEGRGARLLRLPGRDGRVDLQSLIELLGREGFNEVLLEGGSRLIGAALRQNVVDRVIWMIAPRILGGDDAIVAVGGPSPKNLSEALDLKNVRIRRLGPDLVVTGEL